MPRGGTAGAAAARPAAWLLAPRRRPGAPAARGLLINPLKARLPSSARGVAAGAASRKPGGAARGGQRALGASICCVARGARPLGTGPHQRGDGVKNQEERRNGGGCGQERRMKRGAAGAPGRGRAQATAGRGSFRGAQAAPGAAEMKSGCCRRPRASVRTRLLVLRSKTWDCGKAPLGPRGGGGGPRAPSAAGGPATARAPERAGRPPAAVRRRSGFCLRAWC